MKIPTKIIPFFAGISAISLLGVGPTDQLSDTVVWAFRSFIALCIAIIAYFLKGLIDDNKFNNRLRDNKLDNLITITTAHEVMYQYWLENLIAEDHPEDGRRKTDRLHNVIKQIARNKNL